MNLEILLPYAGALALLLLVLSIRVVWLRRKHQVGLGDGGVRELGRAIRAHANFCEYVPIALILLVLLALAGDPDRWLINLLAGGLLIGRILHAYGLSRSAGTSPARLLGTSLTWLVLLVAGALAIFAPLF
ncbi:MAG: MAPEG family protein [Wenzhouxiangellaceae bacterium]